MFDTESVGKNYKMLVKILTILVANIHQKISKDIIHKSSPSLCRQHHDVTNIIMSAKWK